MTALWWTLIVILMLAALIGCVIPLIPDTPLIVCAAVIHHFAFAPRGAGWTLLLILTALMLVSLALEFISGSIGAKYFGATRWGAIGGILGAIVGLFYGPLGLLLGPLIGVLSAELLAGRGILPATRSTWGTLIGGIAGAAAKLGIALIMIATLLLGMPH